MTRQHIRPRARLWALLATAALVVPPSGLAATASAAEPTGSASALATEAADVEVHGLKGEYFSMSAPGARDFAELGGTLLDPQINFSGLTSTFQELNGRTEHTTARWTGQIEAPTTGDYTFYAIGDNGFRLYIDGEPVIDHWEPDWDKEQTSAAIRLNAGEKHDFRLEMFQDFGGANMFLRWAGPGLSKQLVPMSAFTPPEGFEVYPVETSVAADGRRLRARFEGRVGDIGAVKDHLKIEADTTAMPLKSVAVDPRDRNSLLVTLAEPIQKNQQVRVTYDGEGGLTSGGETVPKVIRYADNASTHRLTTKWGDKVDKRNPLPEYPRPQQVRSKWKNLNGPWQFSGAKAGEQPVFGKDLDEKIVVPYPVESQLSGLERHEDHMFYRRLVNVPKDWNVGKGNRLKLNFGAVDYQARVFVNGTKVAEHTGGYDAFSADITDALKGTGPQEVVVAVTDTGGADQPMGKQSTNPGGIFYTQSSGIWQTVWMEPVANAAIDNVVSTPDIDTSSLAVTVESGKASAGARVEAVARDKRGNVVGKVSGPANKQLRLPVAKQHLWSPDDPYLYDLDVKLTDGRSTDKVGSYFGMRKIGIAKVGGFQKLVLNGKPVFSLATLDQGFWPDGLYTAPSDEALAFDLKAHKELGFNAVRKHIKVEPARWFYHADKLGLLVWQDFVSGNITNETGRRAFVDQGREMMREHHNAPSVIGWIVFNEGWGEWDRTETGKIAESVKEADPSRVVNAHSGVNCCNSKGDSGKGDIIDHHDYNNEDPPFPDDKRAAMDGEHGGFTLRTPGHMWPGAPTVIYSGVNDKEALTRKYVENTEKFYLDQAGAELSGSIYTQISDLENELNGLYTYDRREIKVDPVRVREINRKVVAAGAAAGERQPLKGGGHWALDEGSGTTAKDDGPNAKPLTLSTGTTWTPGVSGSALKFDGNGQHAETAGPVLDTTGSYSVSAWVRLDELPGNYATAVSQDTRRQASPFYLQYGQGAFAFSTPGESRARLVTTPEKGHWYHLVGVRDSADNTIKLYVDGKPAATATGGAAYPSTGSLSVGRAQWGGNDVDFWNGAVDEVHAYDKALTAEEVSTLYTDEKP
ncbi:LamG-like jellyroll fold domain-containing protein [Streptomyces chartreusis]|uniref:LamG-like jellyroll fold domain-containing protein n=1 Tax=Streptomyces chartreusis TaxID=1969 RepID=UPI00123CFD87|nr:LamG-like jellyroll fold domain-containing protein [Streptomyces chartreusis]QEV72666.1 glycoside hydrolase family 2 [Streptomyces chartreusis]GGX30730.1 hydrolase [Streptomyces chartreusis]